VRTGELETQMALDELIDRDSSEEWVLKARYVIGMMCGIGAAFTAETIRERLPEAPDPNLFGAVFRSCASEGWIRQVGYTKATRPDAHGRVLAVWRSAS
jgi:hypothetical protein